MDTWERFSRALEEAKRVKESCGCEEGCGCEKCNVNNTKSKKKTPSLNAINTDINNAKNKLRSMGLKMSQELEGELVDEKVVNPYAVGMAAAMKSTGDKPPLKKSTIIKAHEIAKKVEAKEELSLVDKMIAEFGINSEDLTEAPKDTISGGTSKSKKYKTQAKGVRAAQMGSAAMSGDMGEVQRLGHTKTTVKKKKTPKPSQEPQEQENTSETSTKKSKSGRGMSAKTAAERAAAIRAAARTKSKQIEAKARLAAEKEKTARQEARFKRSDAQKAERAKQSAGDAAVNAYKEKTQKRRQNRAELMKALHGSGATATSKQTDLDVLGAMGSNIGSAVKGLVGYGIKRYQQNKDERNIAKLRKDAETKASESQSGSPESSDSPKTPKALKASKAETPTDSKIVPVSVKDVTPKSLPMGIDKRKMLPPSTQGSTRIGQPAKRIGQPAPERPSLPMSLDKRKMLPPSTQGSTRVGQPAAGTRPQIPGSQKRKQIEAGTYKPIKSIGEKYSNWRKELIIEIDDPSVTNDQPERIIDVSKKKNKIEMNPKLSEQRQHLREFLPALLAALGELGGAEAAGAAAAGAGEAAAAGETETLGSKVKDLLKGKSQDLITKKQKNPSDSPTTASSSQSDLDALSAIASNIKKEGFSDWRSELSEASAAWQRKEGKNPEGGLNKKGIASYRREHPGSHLSLAVTTKPSKLKKGSKSWKRRKSFCARMSGMPGPMKDEKGRPTRKALSLRKWNC